MQRVLALILVLLVALTSSALAGHLIYGDSSFGSVSRVGSNWSVPWYSKSYSSDYIDYIEVTATVFVNNLVADYKERACYSCLFLPLDGTVGGSGAAFVEISGWHYGERDLEYESTTSYNSLSIN